MTAVLAEPPVTPFAIDAFDLLSSATVASVADSVEDVRRDAVPDAAWSLDALTARAVSEQKQIELAERAPARHYWFQGKSLNAARRHFRRNHWGNYLKACGISKDQARSARKLASFYAGAEALDGLSVREALRLTRGGEPRDQETSRLLRNFAVRLRNAVKAARQVAQSVASADERLEFARSIEMVIASLSNTKHQMQAGEKPCQR